MLIDLMVFDSQKKLLKVINTGTHPHIIVYNDKFTSDLATGAETYEASFKVPYNDMSLFIEGNHIGFWWGEQFKMMQIKKTTSLEKIDGVDITIKSEFIGMELYSNYIDSLSYDGNVSNFLKSVLMDTNYEVGFVSPSLDTEAFRVEVNEITSVYTVLQNNISTFNGCEWDFSVEVIDSIKGQYKFYVNCYANGERGAKVYKRFEADRNSYGMKREGDITNFCSGIIPIGANGLTITGAKWSKNEGDPLDKDLGQNYLFDPEAHARLNCGEKYILKKYKSSATDVYSLIWEGYNKLMELNTTQFSYDIPVKLTEAEYGQINIGDTNYVVNKKFNPPILLEARISKFEISFTNRASNKITLANFKEMRSKIVNANEIIQEALQNVPKKLTEADIAKIKQFLEDLEVEDSEIEALIEDYTDRLVPDSVEIPDEHDLDKPGWDSENYKEIKLKSIDNGLWIGDDRLYKALQAESNIIEVRDNKNPSTPDAPSTTSKAKEYDKAVKYYTKFSLGTYSKKSAVSALQSSSNKYKVGTIVKYWSKKFGVDPQLVFAMILAESSGNPYCAVGSNAGYGLMQCERSAYFGKKQTIKFQNGTTKSFTPSNSTMNPSHGKTITLDGVKVNGNISNQVMFGCHELRARAKDFNYNIFATLMGYNMGPGGPYWCITHYISNKYGIPYYGGMSYRGLSKQSSKMKNKYYEVLNTLQAPFASYRKAYKEYFHESTPTNIEYYLRWYKVVNGQLPYIVDDSGKKRGYGANGTASSSGGTSNKNTSTKPGVATDVRNKIVAKGKEICALHQKHKKATYSQSHRIVDDAKRHKYKGTLNGIKNPYCYDCTSLVSCAYKCVGLTSVYNASAKWGTLMAGATKKSGYKFWKLTSKTVDDLLPGDIIMVAWDNVPSNVSLSKLKEVGYLHHAILYCGKVNGTHMIAHASGNYKWSRAIRYEKLSDYGLSTIYNKCIGLRPYDIAKLDKEAKVDSSSSQTKPDANPVVKASELNIKAVPGGVPGDFFEGDALLHDITVNGVNSDSKYPSSVSHVFLHFGVNGLTNKDMDDYVALIELLMKKYPKKPIFIAKEYHVNSKYGSNWNEINAQIDKFNIFMQDYANRTKYVIMVKPPKELMDSSNSYIDLNLTNDGFSMKDDNSADKYYVSYKKDILALCTGYSTTSSSTSVSIVMQSQKMYKYSKPLKSLTIKLPKNPDDSYYSRIIFTTNKNSEPTKFNQSDLVYLDGLDCKKGALILKPDTTYTIIVYYNPDKDIAPDKYLGSVSGVRKGGKYAKFEKFKYGETISKNAESFYNNKSELIYDNMGPLDFEKPLDHKAEWTTDGKMHIDDNTMLQYILMGWNFYKSHYNPGIERNNRNKNTQASWALPYISTEYRLAKYFVEHGWVLDGADLTDFSNVLPGDIIFMDSDDKNNGFYMGVSHTAIVINSKQVIAATTGKGAPITKLDLKSLQQDRILFVGRIRMD